MKIRAFLTIGAVSFLALFPLATFADPGQTTQGGAVIQFAKTGRNLTTGGQNFISIVDAKPGDQIEFRVIVRNAGSSKASVSLRDVFPVGLSPITNSFSIDGQLKENTDPRNITLLGDIGPNTQKEIRFRAVVDSSPVPQTLTNKIIVQADSQESSGTMSIRIRAQSAKPPLTKDGPGEVITGPSNPLPWVLGAGFAGSLALYAILYRFRFRGKNLLGLRAELELQSLAKELKEKEGLPDTDL